MHRALLPLSLVAVLALTACSGDDESLGERETAAARSLAAEFQGNDPTAAQRDSGVCLGKALVRSAGVDKLVSSGMLTDDLAVNKDLPDVVPPEIAEAYADAVVDCQDPRAEIEDRRTFYPDATDEVIDSYVACMEDVDDALLRAAVLESAGGGGETGGAGETGSGDAATAYLKATKPCTDLLGTPKTQ